MFRPPTRREELGELLQTSLAVLARALSPLVDAGIVVRSVEEPEQRPFGARGRPPRYASLAPGAAHAIGVEIGSRALRLVICDLTGAIVVSRTVPWCPVDPAVTIDRIGELVTSVLSDAGLDFDRVIGLGLSSAQELAPDRAAAGAFAGWYGVQPANELQQRLGMAAAVERATIAGALAEQRFGAGRGLSDLMYVRLSAGCGVGFILDGEPFRGANGIAGEVGHVPLTVLVHHPR
jgi:predicted NBD/HSP70 family sugar kinase